MKEVFARLLAGALSRLGIQHEGPIVIERPRQEHYGDLSTNIAMMLAKTLRKNPRELAAALVQNLEAGPELVSRVEVAGPGFINITFTERFYRKQLAGVLSSGERFGRSETGSGKRVQVEFVSANPTGPLTVGHGRGAVYGDTVARLLEWTGHDVEREYYFNNAGRQMRILGDSVRLRYLELLGEEVQFPEDYYQGEYIRDIARHLVEVDRDGLRTEPAEGRFKGQAEADIFLDIRSTLERLGIAFDSFFNEHSLYTDGKIDEVIAAFREQDLVYEQEGALWFKSTAFALEKDKVIVKSTGEPTYRLPDIAYHREKFLRGYDLIVDVFGADHIATFPDVLAGIQALGFDPQKVRVLIHQFVTIVQGGEVVKMSTRKANYVTLDELIDEVGGDVVRYFFLMRTITSHLNFDLALAKEQSDENPVYYLQYAHARICSILRYAESAGVRDDAPDLELLSQSEEQALIKAVLRFPETVESCALTFEPHRLADYLHELAGLFHSFYHVHRVVTDDRALSGARLRLVRSVRLAMQNGLSILGIGAPEKM
jgi:arginyl-tRNA synthetase